MGRLVKEVFLKALDLRLGIIDAFRVFPNDPDKRASGLRVVKDF